MRITLILPRVGIYRYKTGAFLKYLRYSPLTLVSLASMIPEELHATVEIYDEGVEGVPKASIQADLVGITAITGASRRAYAYADYFRNRGIPVVMGGVHATLMPEEAALHADSVVTGPAYETWPRLLKDFKAGTLKKFYHAPDKIDFKHVPDIDRTILQKKNFISVNITQAVFGCPNSCDFCVTPIACQGYHHRPVADVVREIGGMKGKYVTFVDPSPIEKVSYALELYRAMIPLGKRWLGLATTRLLDHPELMDVMHESGCKGLLIGFESLSQQSVSGIKKGFNRTKDYLRLARELHDRGIAINGCFVHGLDGDGPDCFKRTLDFVLEAGIDLPRFTVCTPFPGTDFFNKMEKSDRILSRDWSLYDAQHVVFKPVGMTVQQLEEGHRWIWDKAYTVASITKRLTRSMTFLEYAILANIGYRYYAKALPRFHNNAVSKDGEI
jgi:radical SAM superfamily enzyme YgiQ (UPF0313 family)